MTALITGGSGLLGKELTVRCDNSLQLSLVPSGAGRLDVSLMYRSLEDLAGQLGARRSGSGDLLSR